MRLRRERERDFIRYWLQKQRNLCCPSTNWRPRKARDVVQRLESQRYSSYSDPKPENQEHRGQEEIPALSEVRQRVNSTILCLLVLFRPSTDWMVPTHITERDLLLLSSPIQMFISSRNTHTDTPRNNV